MEYDYRSDHEYAESFQQYRSATTRDLVTALQDSDRSWEHLEQAAAAVHELFYRMTNVFDVHTPFLSTPQSHPARNGVQDYAESTDDIDTSKSMFKAVLYQALRDVQHQDVEDNTLSSFYHALLQQHVESATVALTPRQVQIFRGLVRHVDTGETGFQVHDHRMLPGMSFPNTIALWSPQVFESLRGNVPIQHPKLYEAFQKTFIDFDALEIFSRESLHNRMACYVIFSAADLMYDYYALISRDIDAQYSPQVLADANNAVLVYSIVVDCLLASLCVDAIHSVTEEYPDMPLQWIANMVPSYFPSPDAFFTLIQQSMAVLVSPEVIDESAT